jgi:Flp pilus assembly protein TadD
LHRNLGVGLALAVAGAGATAVFLARRPQVGSPEAPSAEAVAENDRGKALQREGHLEEADAAYRHALVLAPHYQPARFNLALVKLRRGDAASALSILDQIASESPGHPSVLRVRAEAHRQLGNQPRALEDLEEHVRRHPDDSDGWLHLGRARLATHASGAEDAFCRARRLGNAEAATLCP